MIALGYRPSILAQGLVSGHSKSLGLLVSNVTNPFYPQLVAAVEEVASKKVCGLLCNTCDDPERSKNYIDRLLRQGVDGIIPPQSNGCRGLLAPGGAGIPLVLINGAPGNCTA